MFRLLSLLTASVACMLLADLAQAQCGELPTDFCASARVLPNTPGVHQVMMDVHSATDSGEVFCGVPVGHTVWFQMTPSVSGILTFSTCHPNTTYDTVASAWSGGEASCEFMEFLVCNDDTPTLDCANGCSAYGSTLTFPVTAGERYRFGVGSYNYNSAGCDLCLGVVVTLCDPTNPTPPSTAITSPTPLDCVCDTTSIFGTADQPGGALGGWRLESMPASGGTWSTIASGTHSVVGGLLGTWYASGLSDGYYLLRLTAWNPCNVTSTSVQLVWLDQQMNSTDLRAPAAGQVVGGTVCADGTAWDHCGGTFTVERRPLGGLFSLFDTLSPPWTLNDPLGTWNTRNGVPDGAYEIRLSATDACGNPGSDSVVVEVDNTPPSAVITSPMACSLVDGTVQIRGTANDAHLLGWSLSYSGGGATGWVPIASGSSPVINGVLGNWNAGALPDCGYTLRLIVTDRAILDCNGALHNQSEYNVSVQVGEVDPCVGDIDGDNDVDLADLALLLSRYGIPCP